MRADQLILIASIITALTVIFTTALKIFKMIKIFYTKLHDFQESINENAMYTLKLVVLNENLDIDERISDGKSYIEIGGKGFVNEI